MEVSRAQWRETFRVINVGPVAVPAGTFQAAEVLRITERNGLPWYTFRDGYAPGVGYIRRTDENGTSVIFKLEAYWGGELRTETTTWGAIKALYRN